LTKARDMTPRRSASSVPPTSPTRAAGAPPAVTPDGRYLVVRGRLWRRTDPRLAPEVRSELVRTLMDARRGVRDARRDGDPVAERSHRAAVHAAKIGLGERGPVWWTDGAPDYTRRLARTTPYADWWAAVEATDRNVEAPDPGAADLG
jgi:hypothetical protein